MKKRTLLAFLSVFVYGGVVVFADEILIDGGKLVPVSATTVEIIGPVNPWGDN